jgi:Domain of unknown function (DUF397)
MTTDSHHRIPADQLKHALWRKSSHSGKEGNCVELAHTASGTTAFRDSHDPHGPTLTYPTDHMAAFLCAAKDGEFDGHHQ